MSRTRWHILREGETLTLARHLPPRFDVSATTTLGAGDAAKLAHQIRQDIWRALQDVRGFSPVVRLEPCDKGWSVTAGGRVSGRPAPALTARLAEVLEDPGNRARWQRFAGRRAQ